MLSAEPLQRVLRDLHRERGDARLEALNQRLGRGPGRRLAPGLDLAPQPRCIEGREKVSKSVLRVHTL